MAVESLGQKRDYGIGFYLKNHFPSSLLPPTNSTRPVASTMSFIDRATQLISDAPAMLSELESERAAVFGSAKMSEVRR